MARQLNIRTDEAVETAKRLAGRVVSAGSENLTPEQAAAIQALCKLGEEAAKYKLPGATSDHSDMYDQNGLPL